MEQTPALGVEAILAESPQFRGNFVLAEEVDFGLPLRDGGILEQRMRVTGLILEFGRGEEDVAEFGHTDEEDASFMANVAMVSTEEIGEFGCLVCLGILKSSGDVHNVMSVADVYAFVNCFSTE